MNKYNMKQSSSKEKDYAYTRTPTPFAILSIQISIDSEEHFFKVILIIQDLIDSFWKWACTNQILWLIFIERINLEFIKRLNKYRLVDFYLFSYDHNWQHWFYSF